MLSLIFLPIHSQVVADRLYVAGDGKVCVFNTGTYETLPPIGVTEFAGYLLNGMGYNANTKTLWVTSTGYDLRASEPDGRQMIASVDLGSHDVKNPIMKHVNFHGEMAYLYPKAVAVNAHNGACLAHYSLMSNHLMLFVRQLVFTG